MTKEEALTAIKKLREQINDSDDDSDPKPWINAVCYHLDVASDVLEFPVVSG